MNPDMPAATEPLPAEVIDLVRRAEWITVFSGAGMSAESGIPTFRDDENAMWDRFDPGEMATVSAWERDPALVWGWYQWRAGQVRAAQPNAGHRAVADLSTPDRTVMVVTQNVDDLHERAGSSVLSHLHGSLYAPRCSRCSTPYDGIDAAPRSTTPTGPADLAITPPSCPVCGGDVRPGVVWFGEELPVEAWQRAEQAMTGADVVLVVGTSGVVEPAASLPIRAWAADIPVIEFNPRPSELSSMATHSIRTSAAVGLPALIRALG